MSAGGWINGVAGVGEYWEVVSTGVLISDKLVE